MKRILLVEDDLAIRQLLSVILQNEKYAIVKAANGKEGLATLGVNNNHIDLILSDIIMEDMDGFEFIKIVKSTPDLKKIPFVFLSAKTDPESRVMGLKLGADDYITKPFNRDEIILKIKLLLEKSTTIKKSTLTGLSGNFRNMSMKEVVHIIGITRRTGLLIVITSKTKGALYFRNGILINAETEGIWGEDSAIKLLFLDDGDFRFEPNPLDDIAATITHTSDELLKRGLYHHELPTHVHKQNNDIVAMNIIPVPMENINGIIQTEQQSGKNPKSQIPVLLDKESIANYDTEKTDTLIISQGTIMSKIKRYEEEHNITGIHIGLVGSETSLGSFIGTLIERTSGMSRKVKFEASSALAGVSNFTLIKTVIYDQVIYFHMLSSPQSQRSLWDVLFKPTVGVIVLDNEKDRLEIGQFVQFTEQSNYIHTVYDTQPNGKLSFSQVLKLLDKVLAAPNII